MFESVLDYSKRNLLDKLERLSKTTSMKDVKNITHTQFPGKHCPLTGALLVSRGLKDSLALVVGTDECVYYSRSMALGFTGYGGLHGRVVSVRLDTNDITFGSVEKVEEAFDELVQEYTPSCVFLISTCLIEIIGDDFDALATSLTQKHNIPVLPVHTEHFKCEDHLPGVERSLTACVNLMEKLDTTETVNVLGQRHGEFTQTEVYSVLEEARIEINLQFPRECTLDIVKTAPRAKMNLVVNDTALPLAQKMQEKFGTPYVYFTNSASPETVYNCYKKIFEIFNKPMPQHLIDSYKDLSARLEEKKKLFSGQSYVYGGAPFTTFEHNRILCELGLKPLLLQLSAFEERDQDEVKEILKMHDPYVARIPNSAAMTRVYELLKPDFSFGVGYPATLTKMGIVPVRFESPKTMLGFDVVDKFLKGIEKAYYDYKALKESK